MSKKNSSKVEKAPEISATSPSASKVSHKSNEPRLVSLDESVDRLARNMHENPGAIEIELLQRGDNLVGIFADPNFTTRRFSNLDALKIETLKNAITDIAGGVMVLSSSSIGIAFYNNKLTTFINPHGSPPDGTVIFSVNWKDIAAFKHWRQKGEIDIPQQDLNSAIYFLTVAISKLL